MSDRDIETGSVIDEQFTLTLDDLAGACRVETRLIIEFVEEGVLTAPAGSPSSWRFCGTDLIRVRKLRQLQTRFDASPAAAALMLDLMEEIEHLRRHLRRQGLDEA